MRYKTKFIDCGIDIPVVEITLHDGGTGFAIVDSGSESTLFDIDFVKNHKKGFKITKTNKKISIIGLLAQKEMDIINLDTEISMGYGFIPVTGAIVARLSGLAGQALKDSEKKICCLLGSDALREMKADINYRTNTFSYDIPGKQQ